MRGLSGCNKRSFLVVESDGSIVQRARWLKAVSSTFLTVYTVPEQSRIYRFHTQLIGPFEFFVEREQILDRRELYTRVNDIITDFPCLFHFY